MTDHNLTTEKVRAFLAQKKYLPSGEDLMYGPAPSYDEPNLTALAQAYLDLKSQNESLAVQVARLEKREARHALLFGVPDGGQYEADWESRAAEFQETLALKGEKE